MSRRTFLHVGPPKTGTSFLQAAWEEQRDRLKGDGLYYLGEHPTEQFQACAVAMEITNHTRRYNEHQLAAWDRFKSEIKNFDGDALLSCEFWSRADADLAADIVTQLKAVSDEVHLVITARDSERQLIAEWQQGIKMGHKRTFADYREALNGTSVPARNFRYSQLLPDLAQRWLDAGVDALTVLVLGPAGSAPEQLWRDASKVLGVPDEPLPQAKTVNESIGAVELEIIRRANAELPADRDAARTAALGASFLTSEIIELDLPRLKPALAPEDHAKVLEMGRSFADGLGALADAGKITVVGNLEDLVPDATPKSGGLTAPENIDPALLADGAARLAGRLFASEARNRDTIESLEAEVRDLRGEIERLHGHVGLRNSLRHRLSGVKAKITRR